jgi:lactate dehydrogenase-like 2-hydroxyacid dehydrogenase
VHDCRLLAISSPHIGSATRETRDAMGFRALDNLDAIFAGRAPRDQVA